MGRIYDQRANVGGGSKVHKSERRTAEVCIEPPSSLLHRILITTPLSEAPSSAFTRAMPAVPPGSKVLVTGANGFLAIWTVRKLLESGFAVRGTVRTAARGEYIMSMFKSYGDKLEIVVVPDIEVVSSGRGLAAMVQRTDGCECRRARLMALCKAWTPWNTLLPRTVGTRSNPTVRGCLYIILECVSTAFPLELINPAVRGTLGILNSVFKNGRVLHCPHISNRVD